MAKRAGIQERTETLTLLLNRLSEAGEELPEFKQGELRMPLFVVDGGQWTLDNFINAMLSERDQAEIRTIDDLRDYARADSMRLRFCYPSTGDSRGWIK